MASSKVLRERYFMGALRLGLAFLVMFSHTGNLSWGYNSGVLR
jgi:hypothetical protein